MIQKLAIFVRLVFVLGYLALGWIVGLVLIPVLLVRVAFFLGRLMRALAPAGRCPDGHRLPHYGRHVCTVCRFEGFSWSWACRWCGATYGHQRCPTCGQSVGNPLA